jgi:hypothetical protein
MRKKNIRLPQFYEKKKPRKVEIISIKKFDAKFVANSS